MGMVPGLLGAVWKSTSSVTGQARYTVYVDTLLQALAARVQLLFAKISPSAFTRGLLVWLAIAIFSAAYIRIGYLNETHLQSGIDLGTYTQILWNVNEGNIPPFNTIKGQVAWGDHAHFVMAIFAPIFSLFPSPITVLVLQVLALTTSAWAVYVVARKLVGGVVFPYAIAVAYLAFFGVQYALDFDFHANTLTAAVLAWSFYAFHTRRWPLYWLLLALGLTTREDAATFYVMFGVLLLVIYRKKYWLTAAVTVAVSLVYFFAIAYVVMPRWHPAGTPLAYFDAPIETRNPLEIGWWLISNPKTVWQNMTETSIARRTLRHLFQSFGYVPLLSPATYVLALPNLLARFLSPEEQRHMMKFHYSVSLAPVLAYGSTLATVWLSRMLGKLHSRARLIVPLVAASAVLYGTYTSSWRDVDLPLRHLADAELFANRWGAPAERSVLVGITKLIPDSASVASVGSLVPTLAMRSEIYVLPEGTNADWIVLPTKHDSWPLSHSEVGQFIRDLRAGGVYTEVTSFDGWYVFRRTNR